eukprot:TRINITY_DN1403_c0_g1_i1.p1 TRINITY_DN1403_c0_g1~~TRINITY_DN1403_c0_g1_i1.p1  ORF type:complete len:882 (-),score=190.64 TRINITY_DN1403_c0_g1_i1:13-2658(-)
MSHPKKNKKDESEESSQTGESESDDGVESEEEEEPKLKYQRLGSSVVEILKKDAASCLAVHPKFLALGTHWGVVYILDIIGNESSRFHLHQSVVNELSIGGDGEYLASCGDDGNVVINGLCSNETFEFQYNRPVLSIALDPVFNPKTKKQFVFGGKAGQLVFNQKGFWGDKKTILHSGEGPIYTVKWCGSLIAWANDIGVKIYDCETQERITYIDRPRGSPRPDLYRCILCWESETQLIIGWANSVKIGLVATKSRDEHVNGFPSKYVQIVSIFETEGYFISGIAPFGEDLVILAFLDDDEEDDGSDEKKSLRPELRIVSRKGDEISSDALAIHGFEYYKASDYRLDHMANEALFYIVSPKDIVFAKPRDRDDHIAWLLERSKFEKALEAAEGHERELRDHNVLNIGERYIAYLSDHENYEKAAEMCPKILKRDTQLWEKWIFKFFKNKQLNAISPYIPIGNPTLGPTIYEMVLNYFLLNDPEAFLRTVTEWPPNLYKIENIINVVEDQYKQKKITPDNDAVLIALAKLYIYNQQYVKTLGVYLSLNSKNVFKLILEHNLYDAISDKVLPLMRVDPDEAVVLLGDNLNRISLDKIVEQLQPEPKLLLKFLHYCFTVKKEGQMLKPYHDLQVELYANHDLDALGDFLEKSNFYNLDRALNICREKNLWKEIVFILARMGNTQEALTVMIERVGDVKKAIDFVDKQNDSDLWDELIKKSIRNPQFVSGLLENVGTHINPLKLIREIPKGMEIIGLRDRLVKILFDYNLQTSLREGCKDVLKADCVKLGRKLYDGNRRGLKVSENARCSTCNNSIFSKQREKGRMIVFFCHHVFHENCVVQQQVVKPKPTGAAGLSNSTFPKTTYYCPICRQDAQEKRFGAKRT